MALMGVYVLRENGDLTYSPFPDQEGIIRVWGLDVSDRFDFWRIAVEAQALGAKPERIAEISEKWGLTDEDGLIFANRLGIPVFRNPENTKWVAKGGDVPAGFGETVLDALAELYKNLNKRGSK